MRVVRADKPAKPKGAPQEGRGPTFVLRRALPEGMTAEEARERCEGFFRFLARRGPR